MSSAWPLELTGITLPPGRKRSQQLYMTLRELILANPQSEGGKMPPTRQLAEMLGISRNTAVAVYDRLYSDGFIEMRTGDGTYIANTSPGSGQASGEAGVPPIRIEPEIRSGMRMAMVERFNQHTIHQGAPKSFRIGVPAVDQFPFDTWSRLHARFWRRQPIEHMGYGDPAGHPELRKLIAHYLRHVRGLQCEPSQIIITLGAQQAIFSCAALLLRTDDEVVIENPCYWAAAGAFSYIGVKMNGVAVDAEGLLTAQLAGIPKARMVYVSPSCQYPTGATLSLSRRMELLNWASEQRAWIIEDDYDGEYRYSGTPLAPLASLDQSNRVIYIGSFSKVMFPAFRLGYLVAPPQLVKQLKLIRTVSERQPPLTDQMVMASFIAEGHFQKHIRRMRRVSHARRDALLRAWNKHLAHVGTLPEAPSGLHLTVFVPNRDIEQRLIARAKEADVDITGLSDLWLPGSDPDARGRYGLVLGFAPVPEEKIDAAVLRLKEAWNGLRLR